MNEFQGEVLCVTLVVGKSLGRQILGHAQSLGGVWFAALCQVPEGFWDPLSWATGSREKQTLTPIILSTWALTCSWETKQLALCFWALKKPLGWVSLFRSRWIGIPKVIALCCHAWGLFPKKKPLFSFQSGYFPSCLYSCFWFWGSPTGCPLGQPSCVYRHLCPASFWTCDMNQFLVRTLLCLLLCLMVPGSFPQG